MNSRMVCEDIRIFDGERGEFVVRIGFPNGGGEGRLLNDVRVLDISKVEWVI